LVAVAAVASLLLLAPGARAGLITDSVDCDAEQVSQPFVPWIDASQYKLAPDGALEHAGDWSLRGGAAIAAGNESYYVTDEDHAHSLNLPPGSSATTPAVCVGLEHPTLRFFARSNGSLLSSLLVQVVVPTNLLGATLTLPIGVVTPSSSWQPTLPMLVLANLLPLLPGDHTAVAFKFTPLGLAAWDIDDVYVDPWRHR
jgi:hypothetical protein